jgi:adhesin transport system outer membrane protein
MVFDQTSAEIEGGSHARDLMNGVRMKRLRISLAVQAALCLPVGVSHAGELRSELEYLRDTHPLIRANQHALGASDLRRQAAMAGFLPKLTITGDSGSEKIVSTAFEGTGPGDPLTTDLDRKKFNLSIEQNLFNGGKTLTEINIATIDRSIKETEVRSTSQDVLLEALISYLQVSRNRLLIRLAELNEKTTLQQLEMETSRVSRGGGVVVDELQASSRLQIVRERRVFYEQGMRDAITTYEQVFGRPPETSSVQDLDNHTSLIPADVEAALLKGKDFNPKIQQIRLQIARADKLIAMERSNFLPKIDFVVSQTRDNKVAGMYSKKEDSALLKFSWNLFSGGDSINRTRAAVFELKEINEREVSTQRKTAESIRMSWNQYQKGLERLKLLEEASETSRRVMEGRKRLRDAGRETVLAVLDAEVEYYGVLANKVNAMIDARLGSYRLLHAIGLLEFSSLNLDGGEFRLPVRPIDETLRLLVGTSLPVNIEPNPVVPPVPVPALAPEPMPVSVPVQVPASVEIPVATLVVPEPVDPVQAVTALINQWASAWSNKDVAAYGSFYGDKFKTGQHRSKAAWLNFRKPRILGRNAIAVSVEDLQVKVLETDAAEVMFVQNYESGTVKDRSMKKMSLVQTADGWRIVSEESQPMPKPVPVKVQEPSNAEAPVVLAIEPTPVPVPVVVPVPAVVELPVFVGPVIEAPAVEVAPAVDPVVAVTALVEQWASAWSSKDFVAYGSFYGDKFKTRQHRSKAVWLNFRKPRILGRNAIAVSVEDVQVKLLESGQAEVTFVQNYESGTVKDRSMKKMNVVQTADGWRIVSEESQPMPKPVPLKVEEPVKAEAPAAPPVVEPTPVTLPVVVPAPAAVEAPVVAAPVIAAPAIEVASPVDPVVAVSSLVEQWASAWSNKDFAAYGSFYGDKFKTGQHRSKAAWLNFRKPRILGRNAIAVSVEDLQVKVLETGAAEVTFVQNYESGTVKDRSMKKMNVVQTADGWRIVSEESQPMPKPVPVKVQESVKAEEPVKVEGGVATAPETSVAIDPTIEVTALLQQWATAWSSKDFDAYAAFYGDGFKTSQFRSKSAWLKFRQPRVMGNEDIQVTIEDVFVDAVKNGKIDVVFVQRYTSRALKIRSVKRMVMENTADGWKIVSERD